jgi:hypothetical protein
LLSHNSTPPPPIEIGGFRLTTLGVSGAGKDL